MSFIPEVIADSSGKWCHNALRFATAQEAVEYVADLSMRWTSVRETRVVESEEEPNYRWDRRMGAVRLEEPGKGVTPS
jgi:hypothetical protein